MTHHFDLEAWDRWRQDAKEAGLIDTTADLDRPSYERDLFDEVAGEARPVPAEERKAA